MKLNFKQFLSDHPLKRGAKLKLKISNLRWIMKLSLLLRLERMNAPNHNLNKSKFKTLSSEITFQHRSKTRIATSKFSKVMKRRRNGLFLRSKLQRRNEQEIICYSNSNNNNRSLKQLRAPLQAVHKFCHRWSKACANWKNAEK